MLLGSLTVLEVAGSQACLIAGGLLSDLGATVLMLEPPQGCPLRTAPGFQVWARGKHSVLDDPHCSVLLDLSPSADVLIVDEALWEQAGRPQAARVTAVIEPGIPDVRSSLATDVASSLADCYSGFAFTQQGSREGPYFVVESASSYGCAVLADIAVLASIYASKPSQSEVVRISHLAGALAMQQFSAVTSDDASSTTLPLDGDPKRVTTPLIRFYRTLDSWIVIAAVSPSLWVKLCIALDCAELVADPRYTDAPFNIPDAAARIALVETIQSIVQRRSTTDWLGRFRSAGVIAGPVLSPGEVLDTEHVMRIGMRQEFHDVGAGTVIRPGIPITHYPPSAQRARPIPQLGEHDPAVVQRIQSGRSRAAVSVNRSSPPLTGLRVLDLATMAAGPGISRILAGLGAEVIKVEPPEGDPFRGLALSFAAINRGKRSVSVALGRTPMPAELENLIRGADIVVHNLRPSVAAKVGMTSAQLAALNPQVIEIRVSGYGTGGPHADLPSVDVLFEALTGASLLQGGGEPVGYSGGPGDNATALLGTLATLAALHQPDRRGGGDQHLEVSLLATALYRHAQAMVRPLADWRELTLGPDPTGPSPTHRLYAASDGWALLAITHAEEWQRFRMIDCRLPQSFPQPIDSKWAAEVTIVLEQVIGGRTLQDFIAWCMAHDVPATCAQPLKTFLLQAHAARNPLVSRFSDANFGTLIGLDEMIRFEGPGWRSLSASPALGESSLRAVHWSSRPVHER